jgi:hypothetical protein
VSEQARKCWTDKPCTKSPLTDEVVLVGDGAADVCDGVEEFCDHLVYPERDAPSPLWTARGLVAS